VTNALPRNGSFTAPAAHSMFDIGHPMVRHDRQILRPRMLLQRSPRPSESKRQRLVNADHHVENVPFENPYLMAHHTSSPQLRQLYDHFVKPPPQIDLSPCHICHRKPTKKSDLDGYAYCEGCQKRTCYICIRRCEEPFLASYGNLPAIGQDSDTHMGESHGPHSSLQAELTGSWPTTGGHRNVVCSRCCVERGADGEVRCLGCLRAEGS
jgi:hypothetical protein